MRFLLLTVLFLFTTTMSAQNTVSISGNILDKEFNNNPLAFATVSIKGSINETTCDINGNFAFKNLKAGDYTLVFSFVGYQDKELIVSVVDNKTNDVSIVMEAFSPTLNNTTASSDKQQDVSSVVTSS